MDVWGVCGASGYLLAARVPLSPAATYRYDLVDVSRQAMSDYFLSLHARLRDAYHNHTSHAADANTTSYFKIANHTAHRMLEVITDLDRLLGTYGLHKQSCPSLGFLCVWQQLMSIGCWVAGFGMRKNGP